MNVKKTKTIVISKNAEMQAKINVDGKQLEQVHQFKYQGQTITNEGKTNQEIEIRIAQVKSMFIKLNDIFMTRTISLDLRHRAINLNTPPRRRNMDSLCLTRVNYQDRMTNEEVLSRLGVERRLLSQIRTHKLSYFGHIARHDNLQKSVLTGRIVEEEGADPDVSGTTTSKNGLEQPSRHEHQASPQDRVT